MNTTTKDLIYHLRNIHFIPSKQDTFIISLDFHTDEIDSFDDDTFEVFTFVIEICNN